MSNQLPVKNDDKVWDSVLEVLSRNGRLSRFYRLPKHEIRALSKLWSHRAPGDLGKIFALTQQNRISERDIFVESLTEGQLFALLLIVGRSMKCWVETDFMAASNYKGKVGARWTIANA